jgi:hypothetical protein
MRPFALALCATGLTAALALSALPAAAAPADTAGDARCLMTMAALTNSKDEAKARTAQAGVIFFAGRVKADDPSYNFGVRLKTVAAGMNRDTLVAEAQRCGPLLVNVLRELDDAQKTFPAPTPAPAAGAAKPPAKPAPKR